jgi:hypothetical protein
MLTVPTLPGFMESDLGILEVADHEFRMGAVRKLRVVRLTDFGREVAREPGAMGALWYDRGCARKW